MSKHISLILIGCIVLLMLGAGLYYYQNVLAEQSVTVDHNKNATSSKKITQQFSTERGLHENKKTDRTNIKESDNIVALTFDDGPNTTSTKKILEILKRPNVPATFFMVGTQVEKNEAMVKQVKEEGHEIASHTYSHKNLMTSTSAEIEKEVGDLNRLFKRITGSEPKYLRPPFGAYDTNNREKFGMPIALWNVDSQDWISRDSEKIKTQVLNAIRPQSVVLFHDIYAETAAAIESIIESLKEKNYHFVSVTNYYKIIKIN